MLRFLGGSLFCIYTCVALLAYAHGFDPSSALLMLCNPATLNFTKNPRQLLLTPCSVKKKRKKNKLQREGEASRVFGLGLHLYMQITVKNY